MAEAFHCSPSDIGKWSIKDVRLMGRYWNHMKKKREEEASADSPDKMALMFGSK